MPNQLMSGEISIEELDLSLQEKILSTNAQTLSGKTPSDFATSDHNHNNAYMASDAILSPGRLGATCAGLPDGDPNIIPANGWYMGSGLKNMPDSTNWYIIEALVHNQLWQYQKAYRFAHDQKQFERHQVNGTWQPWREIKMGGSMSIYKYSNTIREVHPCNTNFLTGGTGVNNYFKLQDFYPEATGVVRIYLKFKTNIAQPNTEAGIAIAPGYTSSDQKNCHFLNSPLKAAKFTAMSGGNGLMTSSKFPTTSVNNEFYHSYIDINVFFGQPIVILGFIKKDSNNTSGQVEIFMESVMVCYDKKEVD